MENPPLDSNGNQLILNNYYSVSGFENAQYSGVVNNFFRFINVYGYSFLRNRDYLIEYPPIPMFPKLEDLQVDPIYRAQVAGTRYKLKKTKKKNLRKRKHKHKHKHSRKK